MPLAIVPLVEAGFTSDSDEWEVLGRVARLGLGNRKDDLFNRKIDETGVDMDAEAVRFAHELRSRGVRVGLASSSKNAVPILQKAGILNLFHAIVDGQVSERLQLRGNLNRTSSWSAFLN